MRTQREFATAGLSLSLAISVGVILSVFGDRGEHLSQTNTAIESHSQMLPQLDAVAMENEKALRDAMQTLEKARGAARQ